MSRMALAIAFVLALIGPASAQKARLRQQTLNMQNFTTRAISRYGVIIHR